jgi:hypothetical protein
MQSTFLASATATFFPLRLVLPVRSFLLIDLTDGTIPKCIVILSALGKSLNLVQFNKDQLMEEILCSEPKDDLAKWQEW